MKRFSHIIMIAALVLFTAQAAQAEGWYGFSSTGLGGGGMDGTIKALAFDSAGNLYAGGTFTKAGTVSAKNIAKLNASVSSWSALGTGVTYGSVFALAYDSSKNLLYAGGDFTQIGGVAAYCIAKWNGSTWSPLGTGMDVKVFALAIDKTGNLYAGGNFTKAGNVTCNGIAKWNGTSWSALGTGLNNSYDSITALAVDSTNNLYVGGSFTGVGGITANSIAKWNRYSWSSLGVGIPDKDVKTLAMDNADNLYIGVKFSSSVRKWDGAQLSVLREEGSCGIDALAVDRVNNLYASTCFGDIIQWNGIAWSGILGNTVSVNALAVDSTNKNLYVGGTFTKINGSITSYSIAQYVLPQSYTISGRVYDSSYFSKSGVTMTLSTGGTTTTDGSGYYSLTVPPGWSGTVTPSKTGYTFTPKTYSNVTSSQSSQDYYGIPESVSISGYVYDSSSFIIPGVTMTLSTGGTATTDDFGYYYLTIPSWWSGTVTPSKTGYTFTPKTYSNVISHLFPEYYYATNYLSYVVTFQAGTGGMLNGSNSQTVRSGGSTTEIMAVPNSGYQFVNWTGTGGFVTTIANPLIVSNVTANMAVTANFQQTLPAYYTISGTVTDNLSGLGISGVSLIFGSSGSTTTNSVGAYSKTVTSGWIGTVTISKSGYTFTPPDKYYSSITSDLSYQDYFATATGIGGTPGDINGVGGVDLADAILGLRIISGISVTETINPNADVNGDGKIGLPEVVYILQKIAGLRP